MNNEIMETPNVVELRLTPEQLKYLAWLNTDPKNAITRLINEHTERVKAVEKSLIME